eukprot:TRINITY_DN1758_c0_g1_i4.p1 TRINITY_DN1758_c0_g1~~TRINITY_DN1758_c0_g1_i4.p1  ORF type:complete len:299 (-),score=35.49 TRINITY_DN1758_c0_g1_i4:32-823(-)
MSKNYINDVIEHGYKSVAPWKWDERKEQWAQIFSKIENQDRKLNKLRFVTWNVWFANYQYTSRSEQICKILQETNADVICLQEVLADFINILKRQEWVKQYYLSDASTLGDTLERYGVLLISRFPLAKLSLHNLPSYMGRSLLRTDFIINSDIFSVATVHLESLDNAPLREQQIKVIAAILKNSTHATVMGDFNFDAYTNIYDQNKDGPLENLVLPKYVPDFIDVWSELHPHDKGYTYDSSVNTMLHHPTHDKTRIDLSLIHI